MVDVEDDVAAVAVVVDDEDDDDEELLLFLDLLEEGGVILRWDSIRSRRLLVSARDFAVSCSMMIILSILALR